MSIIEDAPAAPLAPPLGTPAARKPSRGTMIGIVAGSVVIAAGLFGGGIATGASISGGTSSTIQQGQFGGQGGTPPSGQLPGGATGAGTGTGTTGTGTTGTTTTGG